mmetsp:Transcript_114299/g.158674  ORF Transcript_114299/g.158674 Transcript_114299/m.158674 type:complete len:293 (-) Transcript_114299:386-1264(-)
MQPFLCSSLSCSSCVAFLYHDGTSFCQSGCRGRSSSVGLAAPVASAAVGSSSVFLAASGSAAPAAEAGSSSAFLANPAASATLISVLLLGLPRPSCSSWLRGLGRSRLLLVLLFLARLPAGLLARPQCLLAGLLVRAGLLEQCVDHFERELRRHATHLRRRAAHLLARCACHPVGLIGLLGAPLLLGERPRHPAVRLLPLVRLLLLGVPRLVLRPRLLSQGALLVELLGLILLPRAPLIALLIRSKPLSLILLSSAVLDPLACSRPLGLILPPRTGLDAPLRSRPLGLISPR